MTGPGAGPTVGPARDAGARFDRLFELGGTADPHPLYRELRHEEPVFWSEATQAWVLTRYRDVRRLLATESDFAVLFGEAGATIHGKTLLQMRGREHRKKTAVVAREIRNPAALRGRIRSMVEEISRSLVQKLPPSPEVVELRGSLTGALPLRVISSLLGVEHPEQLEGWYRDLALAGVENLVGDPARRDAGLRALHRFEEIISPVIARTRARPEDNLLAALARAEYEGAPLPDEELTRLAGFLLTAGVETTDRTLASLLLRLGSRRDEWDRLRNEPGLIVPALAEILRFEAPVQGVGRSALVDAEFSGVEVGEGQRLIGLIGSANRDEEVFVAADRFLIDRFADSADRQFTPVGELVTFGAGPHHCTGSLLAKLELSTVLRDLLSAFASIELHPTTPPVSGVMLRSPERVLTRLNPGR